MVQGNHASGPLVSWAHLIEAVAKQARLRFEPLVGDPFPLVWEKLVADLARRRKRKPAHVHETYLRGLVVKILRHEADRYRLAYQRNEWLASFVVELAKRPTHIVDLNFDTLILSVLGGSDRPITPRLPTGGLNGVRKSDLANLYRRWQSGNSKVTVWKPHGVDRAATSIRLGLRDYGLQPMAYRFGFEQFKKHERIDRNQLSRMLSATEVNSSASRLHDSWISRLMLFETAIIGAGLSSDEWGLQWLLVQRARNHARNTSPPIRWHAVSDQQYLPGVTTIGHRCWESAWRATLGSHVEAR